MLQITRADIVDGQTLDIELSNGHLILLDTRRLPEADVRRAFLGNMEVLPRPSTDGWSIFWRDGPRLALQEILDMLRTEDIN